MRKLLFILPALVIISSPTASQNRFNVNAYGGYTLPVADLQGDFPDTLETAFINFSNTSTLLTTYGINIGIQVKYAVDSAGSQRITAGLNYNSFTGSADYPRLNGSVLSYKNKVSLFTLTAGAEYAINPFRKFVPFIGLELAANFYGGKIEASGDTVFTRDRKSESRFGITANAGVDIKLWNSGGIIAGVRYALTNLIGKSREVETTSSANPLLDEEEQGSSLGAEIPLNDEGVSSTPDKVLNYVQFYLGLSINLGK